MKMVVSALFLLFFCIVAAHAKIHLVFDKEGASWLATDIGVVKKDKEMGGRVSVLESWQGRLEQGEVLNLPELIKFKSEQSRHIECVDSSGYMNKCRDTTPGAVSGSRIVVFLRKSANQSGPDKWILTGHLWLEQGRAYGLYDLETFVDYGTEQSVKDATAKVFRQKGELKAALEIGNAEKRFEALQPLVKSNSRDVAMVASVEIESLKKLLEHSAKFQIPSGSTLPTLECQDDCVGAFYAFVLISELDFWKETAPTLRMGWWNDGDMNESENLLCRSHHSDTESALAGLEKAEFTNSEGMVRELRDYFLATPQLRDDALIVNACNSYLNNVQAGNSTRGSRNR